MVYIWGMKLVIFFEGLEVQGLYLTAVKGGKVKLSLQQQIHFVYYHVLEGWKAKTSMVYEDGQQRFNFVLHLFWSNTSLGTISGTAEKLFGSSATYSGIVTMSLQTEETTCWFTYT